MVAVESYCRRCGAAYAPDDAACTACGLSRKATVPLADETTPAPFELRLAEHLHTRQLFNERYHITRQVGVGGFGAVYEAEDTLELRRVAIKEIGLAGLSAQQTIEATSAFNREVEMLSGLQHASIPRMYEQLTDAEHWYLIMEFIAGQTLEEVLEHADGGCLPLEQALHIGEQICSVLSYLHSQQPAVIFRDLKPANIMLTPEGQLYLIDFGVARFYKPDKLRDTIAFGSPGYASPEQYGRAQTTTRADIYSLGALLHQMLTGSDPSLDPFHFQSLRTSDHSLPVALEKLVARMLAEDREQRPASADEVGKQLKAIAAAFSTHQWQKKALQKQTAKATVPSFSTIGVTVSIYREHQTPVHVLNWSPDGRALASCDEGYFVHIWNAFQSTSCKVANPSLSQILDLAWSPDGSILALADTNHVVQLWRLNTHPRWWQKTAISLGYRSSAYEGHTSPVETFCWSPDGQRIASAETRGTIHIWQTSNKARCQTCQSHTDIIEDLAWSPDGTRLASCSLDRSVRIWRPSDGNSRWRWHAKGGIIVHTLAWSPDSCYLACGASDRAVHVWDTSHNRKIYVYRGHKGAVRSVAWSPDGRRIVSASADNTVHVWSALDGKDAFIYRGHGASVAAVAWSPDGQYLASAGDDAEIHVWKTT